MKIYLVGFMGSGKSTLGRQLASLLHYDHTDLDTLFEKEYRISILDFFAKYDEAAFRIIEHNLLKKTFDFEDHVISTGGGTPCFYDNMNLINRHGISVYIRMTAPTLFRRLSVSKRFRPLVSGLDEDSLLLSIRDRLGEREKYYSQAIITVDGDGQDVASLAGIIYNHPVLR